MQKVVAEKMDGILGKGEFRHRNSLKALGLEPRTYGLKVSLKGYFTRRKDYRACQKTLRLPRFSCRTVDVR
jgi:hypothetical protein